MTHYHWLFAFEVLLVVATLIVAANIGALVGHLAGPLVLPTPVGPSCFEYWAKGCP